MTTRHSPLEVSAQGPLGQVQPGSPLPSRRNAPALSEGWDGSMDGLAKTGVRTGDLSGADIGQPRPVAMDGEVAATQRLLGTVHTPDDIDWSGQRAEQIREPDVSGHRRQAGRTAASLLLRMVHRIVIPQSRGGQHRDTLYSPRVGRHRAPRHR